MPLTIQVGLVRKIGEPNYSSRGGNVQFAAEVEATLVSDPEALHERIRYLFRLAEEALERQLGSPSETLPATPANGQAQPLLASSRQLALIRRLAGQAEIDLEALLLEVFNTDAYEHLSRGEASRLIEILQTEAGHHVSP